jgi:UDP-N-acetylglucosamine 3-dehydrogenase
MGDRVRIGVVGFGAIGRHHARNLARLPSAELVGIADSSAEARAEATASGYRTFASLEEMLEQRLRGIVLSVPTSLHESLALQAIRSRCAVLVEKPIAMNVEQGSRIIDEAKRFGVPLMIGYVERYNPAVLALRTFMRDGGLGRIHGISARRLGVMPARIKDANVLIDIGVHDIDLAAFVLDAPLELRSALGGKAILQDRLDFAFLALEAAGVPVHVETNWITPVKIREVFVTGENGLCHVDYITQEASFAAARDFPVARSFEGIVEQYTEGVFVKIAVEKEEPLYRELGTFVDGIDGAELPNPSIALESLRIAEEATRMIEERHLVQTGGKYSR